MPKPTEHNEEFRRKYPKVWGAFSQLANECHSGGPLDEKTRRLVKVALAIGAALEGATHSAVRHAHEGGITRDELEHLTVGP